MSAAERIWYMVYGIPMYIYNLCRTVLFYFTNIVFPERIEYRIWCFQPARTRAGEEKKTYHENAILDFKRGFTVRAPVHEHCSHCPCGKFVLASVYDLFVSRVHSTYAYRVIHLPRSPHFLAVEKYALNLDDVFRNVDTIRNNR